MAIIGKKMFGKSGARSIARAEVEEMDSQIERLNFLWTGNPTATIHPRLAANPNYRESVREIQRVQGLVSHSFR